MSGEMVGSAAVLKFAGTTYTTDFRTINPSETVDMVDKSAGADGAKTYIATLTDGTLEFGGLYTGTATPGGTVALGAEGTLQFYPAGTAGSAPVMTVMALLKDRKITHPYAGVSEIALSFQFNGAVTWGTA